jgi:hypothetical protein
MGKRLKVLFDFGEAHISGTGLEVPWNVSSHIGIVFGSTSVMNMV